MTMTLTAADPAAYPASSPAPAIPASPTHRADIDGLRAVAVLLVLLYHAGLGFPGGFVGVDVFFVISGYLITGVILREMDAGTFTLRGFWLRRIRRIAPAAVVVTAATLAAGLAILLPSSLVKLAESAIAQQLLMANVYFSQAGGYFDGPAEMKPLLHTWSLAVEEQFYLFFPLALLACRRRSRRFVASALAAACLASLALSVAITDRFPTANFYWLPPRAWELLLGAILAASPTTPVLSASTRNWAGVLGLAAIGACGVLYTQSLPFPGITALIPTLGTVAVIAAGSAGPTLAGRVLAARPMVWVGAASYSIYLWHWPILAFLRHEIGRNLPPGARWGAAAASLALGFLSWALVEEPIRRRRVLSRGGRLLVAYASLTVVMLGLAALLLRSGGLPNRPIARAAAADEANRESLYRITPDEAMLDAWLRLPRDVAVIGKMPGVSKEEQEAFCPSFLLWGDSHAGCVSGLCDRLARERRLSGFRAVHGGYAALTGVSVDTPAREAPSEQMAWSERVVGVISKQKLRHAILVCRWDCKLGDRLENGRYYGILSDPRTKRPDPADAQRAVREGLARTVDRLNAAGVKVWLLSQVPVQDDDLVQRIRRGRLKIIEGKEPRGVSMAEYRRQQAPFWKAFSDAQCNCMPIKPSADWFDLQGFSRLTDAGQPLYFDDNHLTTAGAEVYYRALLEPVFDEIARTPPR